MKPDELQRYAEMIVQRLHRVPARRHAARAAPASRTASSPWRSPRPPTAPERVAVDVEYEDNRVYAARIRHALEGSARPPDAVAGRAQCARSATRSVAIVQVMGEYELDVVADLPPERVAAATKRRPQTAHDGAHPAGGTPARDDLRLADRRVGGARLPRR